MKFNSVFLSGLPLSGKSTLAEKLSKAYRWPVYSLGQLFREDWKRRYSNSEISFEEYWRSLPIDDIRKKDEGAREVIEKGKIIGEGRYGVPYKDLPCLQVFIFADLEIRVRRALDTSKYSAKSFEEIKKILIQREKDELRVARGLYGINYDYRDTKYYHVVINSGLLTIDQEFTIIDSLISR